LLAGSELMSEKSAAGEFFPIKLEREQAAWLDATVTVRLADPQEPTRRVI
jgi:hypothetical protein